MSAVEATEAVVLEVVRVRRFSQRFGYAEIRLPGVHLKGMSVEEQPNGSLVCTPPAQRDRNGRSWPSWALQPGTREAIEREIACLWARS